VEARKFITGRGAKEESHPFESLGRCGSTWVQLEPAGERRRRQKKQRIIFTSIEWK